MGMGRNVISSYRVLCHRNRKEEPTIIGGKKAINDKAEFKIVGNSRDNHGQSQAKDFVKRSVRVCRVFRWQIRASRLKIEQSS